MHKTINRLVLVGAILFAVFYFVQGKIDSPDECEKIAGKWNHDTNTCEQSTSQIIYETLSSGHPIVMRYPETDIQVILKQSETVKESHYLKGSYSQKIAIENNENESARYDRGFIYLNMSKMIILNESENGMVHYVAPFVANTAGSGVFVYVGLFSYDQKSKKSVYLDFQLLGDRVREETISYINNHLKVDFKGYEKGQAYAEYPVERRSLHLQLKNELSNFELIKK